MRTEAIYSNDKDLINALTDDYLNIYRTSPEEDLVDIIKLNGYIPEESSETWNNLCYSKLVNEYATNCVHPDDKERFVTVCSPEYVIKELSIHHMFQGRYRVLQNDNIHYFHYKFVKVSKDGEPLRAVAAFRNVDSLEAKEQKRMSELEHMRSIMSSNDMGTWRITHNLNQPVRMAVDTKMKQLMGIPEFSTLTEEDTWDMLSMNIHPDDSKVFYNYVLKLRSGLRAECTYRWIHPTLGERHMRCGGIKVQSDNGNTVFNGYHYDVTDQIRKEIRSNLIIQSLAHTFVFINYINLSEGTFFTYSDGEIENESLLKLLTAGHIKNSVQIGCEEFVCEEHRNMMIRFSDIKSLNKRLKVNNTTTIEFKNIEDKWYESSLSVAERNEDGTIKCLLWGLRKIDDEKQNELRKQRLLDESIAANNAKTAFLQNMSHEIRTPLNAMLGFAQLLGLPEGTWPEEERKQFNSYILNSYSMLDMLIGDIIDVADSEHGNYRINISEVIVNNICRNAIMSVEYRVPPEVTLNFTTDLADGYTIHSDGRRIQQVIVNYLTNACKHTEKGTINLHCSTTEHPGRLTFSVTDTGEGVPVDQAHNIFQRFTKLNQFVQGSGLGLNICMMIADKLGGEVYLDTTYTNGARFVFVIDDNGK